MFFCYRSLLLNFKREFSFDEIFRVWETIWCSPFPKFNLFVALAMIMINRQYFLVHIQSFDEILKFFNAMQADSLPILYAAQSLASEFHRKE